MNNLGMNKKTWIILVGIVLIIAAGLWLYFLNNQYRTRPLQVTTTELTKGQTPVGLPENLPTEVGSKVLQNYESTTNDGRTQSTKQITSSKAPRAALDEYIQFYKDQGYIGGYAESASQANGQQVAQMEKGGNLLMIVATPAGTNKTIIEFTLTQPAK
jgi:hypothetical protein